MSIGSYAAYAMGLRRPGARLPAGVVAIGGASIRGICAGSRMLDGLADLLVRKSRLIIAKPRV